MGPINYGALSQTPDFGKSLQEGLDFTKGLEQLRLHRAELEKAQLAAQRTAQFRNDVGPALQAGDPAALVQLFGKYPDFGDQIKQASGFLNDADENNKKTTSATVYNGLQSGNVDIAKQALESRVNYLTKIGADANEWKGALDSLNSGDPDKIKQVQQQATLLHALYNPTAIKTMNEVNTDRRAEQLQPAKVREGVATANKAVADASTAAVTAKYADSKAFQDLEKTGWDIKKIGADIDIAKESNRIAAMNAAANRESNSLKRDELRLKIADTVTARDQKLQDKVTEATNGISSIDNILNTIDTVKNHPGLEKAVGIKSAFPTTPGSDAANFEALVETLGSQSFLSQISAFKGMGALSDAEGKKLQSALSNFSIKQSPQQLRKNLGEVERLMTNARENVIKKTGAPASIAGGGVVVKSPKYGDLNEQQVREFAASKGLTRDQAIQVINSVK